MRTQSHNATKTAEPTAPEAYRANAQDIQRLLAMLKTNLEHHAEIAKAQPGHWGLVGDLGKVRSDLIEVVGFMTSQDAAAIEAKLK